MEEFTSSIIEELRSIWPDLKLVHGKPHHPQSQGANSDIKDMHNLKWHQHIESLIDKCSRLIGILKFLKNKLNRKAIEKIFFSYIRPIMEYADIIWAGAPISDLSKLDHIVVEAMRAVTGAPARSNTSNLYKETGWIPLATRREIHVLKMVFKISNNFCPSYLNNILPGIIREYPMQTVNLRHDIESRAVLGNFPPIRTRTRVLDHMFPALGTKLWNALPAELKNASSLKSFAPELSKLKCSSITLSKSTHNLYSHGSRIDNINHACLRMGCSKLNVHLMQNLHVIDHEACACGYPQENINHFFLHCPLYDNIRHILHNAVIIAGNIEISPEILLYGSNILSYEKNIVIFDAVHKYICQSKCFSPTLYQ